MEGHIDVSSYLNEPYTYIIYTSYLLYINSKRSCSVLDLVRTCNRMKLAQNRTLRGRYQTIRRLSTTLVKAPSARAVGEDVAVGSSILTVFQGDPAQTGVNFLFCVGKTRQISAAMRSGKKSQNWLSLADDDASTLMFCSPGAAVYT
jgi:hypothetical protein